MAKLIRIIPTKAEALEAREQARREFISELHRNDRYFLVTQDALTRWYETGGQRPRSLGAPENPRLETGVQR